MNNILLFSDLHISKSSLKECALILEEIGMLANKYNCDTIINLGDTFDNLKPNSEELDLFATFIKRLNKKMIIIAANSHESESHVNSIVNHFGILNENITIVKEFIDENRLYCGHFSIKESLKNYDAKLTKEDLKQYKQAWLGHIHSFQKIKPNVCHLGSSRYVSFDEANDKKVVGIITNYKEESEKTGFIALNSCYPMKEYIVSNSTKSNDLPQQNPMKNVLSIAQCDSILASLESNTKIKVKILDFESFKQFLPLVSKYTSKFSLFKYETIFTVASDNIQKSTKTEVNLSESFNQFSKDRDIDSEIINIIKGKLNEMSKEK